MAGLRLIHDEGMRIQPRLPVTGSGLGAKQLQSKTVRILTIKEQREILSRGQDWKTLESRVAPEEDSSLGARMWRYFGLDFETAKVDSEGANFLIEQAYPDLAGEGPMGVVAGEVFRYSDIVLALVHLHAAGCEPALVRERREEIRRVVRMRMGARRIVAFLKRRKEWRKTWGNPLELIRREVRRLREIEYRLEREEEERQRQREEAERLRVEQERLASLARIHHHDMTLWGEYAATRAPHNTPAEVASYFARCLYYSIIVPLSTDDKFKSFSLLRPSVSDSALEKYGYAPQRSSCHFRTVAIPERPHGEEYGDKGGYTPRGLARAINEAVQNDLRAYGSSVGISRSSGRQWEAVCASMLSFKSLGNYAGMSLRPSVSCMV